MKVLVIAADPDDEVLGVGGTIVRHKEVGDIVEVLFLGDGIASRYGEDKINLLRGCAEKAKDILGIDRITFAGLGSPDKRFDEIPFGEVIKVIEGYIAKQEPDRIYTHHKGDANTDHQIAFKATIAAARTLKRFIVKDILSYQVPSSTEQGPPFPEYTFMPNHFVDITHTLDRKIEALSVYTSEIDEFPYPRSLEGLRITAGYWGMKIGVKAAEAFVVVRQIWQETGYR